MDNLNQVLMLSNAVKSIKCIYVYEENTGLFFLLSFFLTVTHFKKKFMVRSTIIEPVHRLFLFL